MALAWVSQLLLAWVSQLSPVVAEIVMIVMETFEERYSLLVTYPFPSLDLVVFLEYPSSHNDIKFILEIEFNSPLRCLDILVDVWVKVRKAVTLSQPGNLTSTSKEDRH